MNHSTKFFSRIIILMMVALLGVSSCGNKEEDDDLVGNWRPMAWRNVDYLISNDNGVYLISENGGMFSFECTNYNSMWIYSIMIDGLYQEISDEERRSFKGEWLEVKIEKNKFIIKVDPLPSSVESRTFRVGVTVGDTGAGFIFKQQKMS